MDTHFKTDVLIVGGGPSGASTALSLLKYSNLSVTIIDSTALDTVRVGEQVNSSLFALLGYLGIDKEAFDKDSFIENYSTQSAWGSDRMTSRDAIFSTEAGSLQLNREKFDLFLIKRAFENGATVLPRTKCNNLRKTEEGWIVDLIHKTKGEFTIEANFLVDATGRQSHIARKLDLSLKKDDDLVAVGAFLQFGDPTTLRRENFIESVPEGWWYSATLPNQQMVVSFFTDASIVKEKQLQKTENWNKLLAETIHTKNRIKNAASYEKLWVRNAFSHITDSAAVNNFVAVGDAVASFDPISSMGIGFAISSACHAAKAIIDRKVNLDTLTHYQASIEGIFNEYRATKALFYQKERRWQDEPFWHSRTSNITNDTPSV